MFFIRSTVQKIADNYHQVVKSAATSTHHAAPTAPAPARDAKTAYCSPGHETAMRAGALYRLRNRAGPGALLRTIRNFSMLAQLMCGCTMFLPFMLRIRIEIILGMRRVPFLIVCSCSRCLGRCRGLGMGRWRVICCLIVRNTTIYISV
jgi:hypothetical protein